MPDEEKDEGRVVYSRLDGGEDEGRQQARPAAPRPQKGVAAPEGGLWRALLPLSLGFALLVALVFGLGLMSAERLSDTRFKTQDQERRLSFTLNSLLNLRLGLSQLDTEARLRARVESGTRGVLLPPTELRLKNARSAVETQLAEYDKLPIRNAARKQDIRRRVVEHIELTRDLEAYSLRGFASYRDLEEQLRTLLAEVGDERSGLEEQRDKALRETQGQILSLMWLAALTGLLVAVATILEVWRRFRQMRRGYEALRRERQFSTQMLEGMPSAVVAVDRQDRIRSANAAFFEVFPGARPGASVHEDFAPPEGMRLLASATATRVRHATYRGRFALPVGGDGSAAARSYDVYASPLEIEGEQGQLVTLVDVTEAAEAEQELRRSEALAAVGQAAAQVAHEIKNPLGSIRLGVAMLRDMTRDSDAISTIDLVERGINHLSKLTLDVTQFSRRRQLTLVEVTLPDLMDDSLDLVADKVREKRTPVERRYTEEPIEGRWDEDQLRQVFVNLLANAVDASPAESPVVVTVSRAEVPRGARRNGEGAMTREGARVVIADRGQGMDEKTAARIFEPFFTTKKKGTGLGLAIAKQIVEQHGGTIRAESKPGEGTRFIIDLPLAPEAV
ncbi:MAG TPA: ATP-binding protein [Pyrinomonadaceae bacterium]|jgi:signal transduction histidine kinase|nr:ATP-binding protein [Pyrinomonadaceae bacterium]